MKSIYGTVVSGPGGSGIDVLLVLTAIYQSVAAMKGTLATGQVVYFWGAGGKVGEFLCVPADPQLLIREGKVVEEPLVR